MKWRCALIQRKLPDYPDGELSPFWKRRVAAHVEICPECRLELEELSAVVRLYQDHPLPDPGPAFWQEFEQELHLKLAQLNQSPEPAARYRYLPHYLLGATALAGILALAVYLGPFSRTKPAPQLAHRLEKSPAPAAPLAARTPRAHPTAPLATRAPQAPPVTAGFTASQPRVKARPRVLGSTLTAKPRAVRVAQPELPPAEAKFSLAAKLEAAPRPVLGGEGLWPDDDFPSWDVSGVATDLSRQQREDLKKRLESRR
ncbi:MAG: zf-HC2 domain-containing protein [Syntrophobacterales bacterium]|jgi:hypothetical protein